MDQQGHATDVVDVRVAEHQGLHGRWLEREGLAVAPLGLHAALDHAAVQQHPLSCHLDLMQRPRDLARGTVEMYAHALLLDGLHSR